MDDMVPHDEYDDEMFITDMGQVVNTIHPKFASSFDLFGVLGIEILENIQLPLTLELPKNVVFYDDVLKVTISPVVVEFNHVDPQFLLMYYQYLSPILNMYLHFHIWI